MGSVEDPIVVEEWDVDDEEVGRRAPRTRAEARRGAVVVREAPLPRPDVAESSVAPVSSSGVTTSSAVVESEIEEDSEPSDEEEVSSEEEARRTKAWIRIRKAERKMLRRREQELERRKLRDQRRSERRVSSSSSPSSSASPPVDRSSPSVSSSSPPPKPISSDESSPSSPPPIQPSSLLGSPFAAPFRGAPAVPAAAAADTGAVGEAGAVSKVVPPSEQALSPVPEITLPLAAADRPAEVEEAGTSDVPSLPPATAIREAEGEVVGEAEGGNGFEDAVEDVAMEGEPAVVLTETAVAPSSSTSTTTSTRQPTLPAPVDRTSFPGFRHP